MPAESAPPTRKPNNLLQFFSHIVPDGIQESRIQDVRQAFSALASILDQALPDNSEKTVALRKLMEAKESAVRAVLFKAP